MGHPDASDDSEFHRPGYSCRVGPHESNPFTPDTGSVFSTAVENEWWTVAQAAAYLQCARITVYRAMKSGRLRAKKFGRAWRTKKDWIDHGALLSPR